VLAYCSHRELASKQASEQASKRASEQASKRASKFIGDKEGIAFALT